MFAALLLALTLAMKLLVPAGYMFDRTSPFPAVVICPDANPNSVVKTKPAAASSHGGHNMQAMSGDMDHMSGAMGQMSDDAGQDDGSHGAHGSKNPCPYSLLPMASMAAAEGTLLAIALTFILTLGFARVLAPQLARSLHLRPPLRGPPIPVR